MQLIQIVPLLSAGWLLGFAATGFATVYITGINVFDMEAYTEGVRGLEGPETPPPAPAWPIIAVGWVAVRAAQALTACLSSTADFIIDSTRED